MEPFVFALATAICDNVGPPFQVEILFSVIGGDGAGNPISLGYTYLYDTSMPASSNIANMKAGIAALVSSQNNLKLLTNNVNILMTVN